jgi:hypothetical protein
LESSARQAATSAAAPSSSRSVHEPNLSRLDASRSSSVRFVAGETVAPCRSRNTSQNASKVSSPDGSPVRSRGSTLPANQRRASVFVAKPVRCGRLPFSGQRIP